MKNQDRDDEIVGHVLGTGTWRDWLPKLPRPIFALGKNDLYSVLLHGQDFILPIGGSEDPVIGFYTTRWVAAENYHKAEKKAFNSVIQEWNNKGYFNKCGRKPNLSTEKVVILNERFRLRSGAGFTFYSNEDSD
jgi:hypothetical protein